LQLPDGVGGGAAVGFDPAFAGDAGGLALVVDLVVGDAFVRRAGGFGLFEGVAAGVVGVGGLEAQFVGFFGQAQVLRGVAALDDAAIGVADFDDLFVFVAQELGGVAAGVAAEFGPGAGVVADFFVDAAVDHAPHQFAGAVVGEVFDAPSGFGGGAGDLAVELFVGVVVFEEGVGEAAIRGGALFDGVAGVGELFYMAGGIGDAGEVVAAVVGVAGGVAAGVGDLGEAVFGVVGVLDFAGGEVAGEAGDGGVTDFREEAAGVVEGVEHPALPVHDAAQLAAVVAGEPDGVVVLVAPGDDLALGVVVDPVAAPVDPPEAFGVGLRVEGEAARGELAV